MKYIYRHHIYKVPHETTYSSLDEALRDASADFEFGEAWGECIVDEDGRVIIDHETLVRLCGEIADSWDQLERGGDENVS